MLLLKIFYIALFLALIFFGPLQEYWEKKRPQWVQITTDPEKMGLIMCIVLIILASTFFIGKIL